LFQYNVAFNQVKSKSPRLGIKTEPYRGSLQLGKEVVVTMTLAKSQATGRQEFEWRKI